MGICFEDLEFFVNIPILQDANSARVLMSWEAFSLAHPGCSVANDNAASVSFEGLVGNLLRAGVIDLARLDGFQYVPYEGLTVEVARIQEVKAAFFEQFWEPSGKVAVRTLAAAAAEVGLVPATFLFFLLFALN